MTDKFMGVGGRSNDGLAKPLNLNKDGTIPTTSKMEYIHYHKGNIGLGLSSAKFEQRTVGTQTLSIPHAIGIDGSPFGCFDQTIVIENDYDVEVDLKMYACVYDTVTGTSKWLYEVLSETTPTGRFRLVLTPESSTNLANIREISELRQPIPVFQVVLTFNEAPTIGEMNLFMTRRF